VLACAPFGDLYYGTRQTDEVCVDGQDAVIDIIFFGAGVVKLPTCLSFFERVLPLRGRLACVEGKIDMAARRQVTNKLRDGYRNATKRDKARVLDEVMATTGMGRLTARRMLTGPALPSPVE